MRVAITGATGFVGRSCVARLMREGVDFVPWSRPEVDLRDARSVRAAIERTRPTHVLHLAAAGVLPSDARAPSVAVDNTAMAASLIDATVGTDVRIVAAGSMAEYGAPSADRIDERAVCAPTNPYGIGKLASTLLLAARDHTSIARLFGAYGPAEAPHRLFPAILRAVETETALPMSDGLQVRDFIHVDDCADVLLALLRASAPPKVVNVGTGVGISVREISERMLRAAGGSLELLAFGARPRNATDVDRLVADTNLLERTLGRAVPSRLQPDDLGALVRSYRGLP